MAQKLIWSSSVARSEWRWKSRRNAETGRDQAEGPDVLRSGLARRDFSADPELLP